MKMRLKIEIGGTEMVAIKEYFEVTNSALDKACASQREQLLHMAKAMGDIMLDNGVIQLFGVEQDRAFSMELGYRAGGLMPYHQMNVKDLVLRGIISENEMFDEDFYNRKDLAEKLWETYNIEKNDAIMMSVTCNAYDSVLEVARLAKEKGHKVMLVGNKKGLENGAYQANAKELLAIADLFLDLSIAYPDTVVSYKNGIKITQVANVVANVFAQMLTAETYRYLTENGHDAPILLSANVTGADVHNRAISDKYDGRWNS